MVNLDVNAHICDIDDIRSGMNYFLESAAQPNLYNLVILFHMY